MKSGTWPKTIEDGARRLLEPLVAVIRHDEPEPPERPRTFTVVDEHGVEREVYAPRGHVTRWPW